MRNKINQKNEINLFCFLKVSHLLIYILVIIFFKFKHQNPREKGRNKKTQSSAPSPPNSRISIDPCTSKIRYIYRKQKQNKQTEKNLEVDGLGIWELRGRRAGPREGVDYGPHRSRQVWAFCVFPGEDTTLEMGKALNGSPLPCCLGRG